MENENDLGISTEATENNLPVSQSEPFEGESFEASEVEEPLGDRYYEIFEKGKTKTAFWSLLSLVFGIASVCLCMFGWVSLSLGVLAVVFSVVSRMKLGFFDGKTLVGMTLGIFGIVFGVVMIIWNSVFSENLFTSLFGKEGAAKPDNGGISDI